jgi:hypothetical protein
MQIDFEVQIDTSQDVSIEVDDSEIWDAVSDSVDESAREAVSNYAWDTVESEVESMVSNYVEENAASPDIDDAIETLLSEYNRRVQGRLTLCNFGQQFRRAIELTNERLSETENEATENEADLSVIHGRLDTIETTLRDLGAVLKANAEPF